MKTYNLKLLNYYIKELEFTYLFLVYIAFYVHFNM